MAKLRVFPPGYRITSAAGVLITDGATIDVYAAGTNNRIDSYTDSTGGTTNANPYVVPATGIPAVWVDSGVKYRFIIKTAGGTTLHDLDEIVGVGDSVTGYSVEDAVTSNTTDILTLIHTTTGTPAAGIGASALFKSESADENPSDFGRVGFIANDVSSGTEDTVFRVWTRTAGAAIAKAYDFIVTGIGNYVFTGAPTATRTVTLPNTNLDLSGLADYTFSGAATAPRTITLANNDMTLGNTVYFFINLSASQLIGQSSETIITFDDVEQDSHSYWDSVNNRYTPLISGRYSVTAVGELAGIQTTKRCTLYLYKNTSYVAQDTIYSPNASGAGSVTAHVHSIVSLNGTTDYIQVKIFNSDTTNRFLNGSTGGTNPSNTYLLIHKIG